MVRGSYILFLLGLIYVVASFFGSIYFVGFIGSADAQEVLIGSGGGFVGDGGVVAPTGDASAYLMPEEPAFDVSNHLNKNYTCGGEKTKEMLNTINDFQQMVGDIKGDAECERIRKGLNGNVPELKDIKAAIGSDELAQEMREQKRRLRDVESAIRKVEAESSAQRETMPPGMPGGLPSPELQKLNNTKVAISRRISQLEVKLGIGEKAQVMKKYTAVLDSADKYFGYIGEAFQKDCIEDTGVQEQAFFSMTGIVGMFIGATPLGMGLAGASKLINHFSDIDKKYDTSALDDVSLIVGIRCALRNTQKQHCELITNRELELEKSTEAQSCTDCPSSGFSKDIENLFNVVNPQEADTAPSSATDFYRQFTRGPDGRYEGSAKQALDNLNTFVSVMVPKLEDEGEDEDEFMKNVGMGSHEECARSDNQGYRCAILDRTKAKEIIKNIKSAVEASQATGIRGDNTLQATFQAEIMKLSNQESLKSFTELVLAYSDYQSQKIDEYSAQNVEIDFKSPAGAFRYINSFSIRDLLDVSVSQDQLPSSEYQAIDDQSQAEYLSNIYMQTFSDIFNDHALAALDTLEEDIETGAANAQLKNNMCMELVGLKISSDERREQSVHEDIDEKCEGTTVTIEDKNGILHTFKYSDYMGKSFEDRVCAMQNFMNCVDGITCFAHNRAQSSPPDSTTDSSSDAGDASATTLKPATR